MGLTGIEHYNPASVIQAYTDYEKPNFSIWSGKRLCVVYEDGNSDQGLQLLINALNTIAMSNTSAVYTLKVYDEDCGRISSKTEYRGSTTFMFTGNAAAAPGEKGMVMFQGAAGPAKTDPAVSSKLATLEKENTELREKLHKTELQQLRDELTTTFETRISGITAANQEPTTWDKVTQLLDNEKLPNLLEKIVDKIADIITGKKENYIQQPGGGAVSGTNHKQTEQPMENDQIQLTAEGALVNPYLSPEEMEFKKDRQSQIMRERLKGKDQEEYDGIQSDCLEIIEKRVGAVTLCRMLIAVACLDNHDLNKLLNNLD